MTTFEYKAIVVGATDQKESIQVLLDSLADNWCIDRCDTTDSMFIYLLSRATKQKGEA